MKYSHFRFVVGAARDFRCARITKLAISGRSVAHAVEVGLYTHGLAGYQSVRGACGEPVLLRQGSRGGYHQIRLAFVAPGRARSRSDIAKADASLLAAADERPPHQDAVFCK